MAGPFEGRCECGRIGYRLTDVPIVVNCCHCLDCQRLGGALPPERAERLAAAMPA